MRSRLAPETVIAAALALIAVVVAVWAAGNGNLDKAVALFWPLAGVSLIALLLGALRGEPQADQDESHRWRDRRPDRERFQSWAD